MSWARENFIALDHVKLAMPVGQEERARAFYGGVLGMAERATPAALRTRGGVWFIGGDGGAVQIHVAAGPELKPARWAHPAVLVADIDGLAERIREAGQEVTWEEEDGDRRFICEDPFGNRLEFIEGLEL